MTNQEMEELRDACSEASPDNDPMRVADRRFYRLAREKLFELVAFARENLWWNVTLRESLDQALELVPRDKLNPKQVEKLQRILRAANQGSGKRLHGAIQLRLEKGCSATCALKTTTDCDCDCGHQALFDALHEY